MQIQSYFSYKVPVYSNNKSARLIRLILLNTIMDPFVGFYYLWRIINITFIIYFVFEIPLLIGFSAQFYHFELNTSILYTIAITGILIFILDIGMSINVGYYQNGIFVANRKKIIQKYTKYLLYFDIISIIVIILSYITYSLFLSILKILFILKVPKLNQFDKQNQYLLKSKRKTKMVYKFARLIFIFFFFMHTFACLFYLLDFTIYTQNINNYAQTGNVWLLNASCWSQIINFPWHTRYLYSLYWSVISVATIGYGDIYPLNPYENFYFMFLIIQICILFGYFVNSVFSILSEYYYVQQKLYISMHMINIYLKEKRIPYNLRYKIRRYLQYIILEEGLRNKEQEEQILSKFSSKAYKYVALQENKRLFSCIPYGYMTEDISLNLAPKIRVIVGFQNDEVCYRKDCLYFLQKGKITEFYKTGKKQYLITKISSNILIKVYQFFTGFDSKKQYKSDYYTETLEIKREDYFKQLDETTKQKVHILIYKLLFQKKLFEIGYQCFICKLDHFESQCNKLHLEREVKILDPLFINLRSSYKRKNIRKQKMLVKNQELNNINQIQKLNSFQIAYQYSVYYPFFNFDRINLM